MQLLNSLDISFFAATPASEACPATTLCLETVFILWTATCFAAADIVADATMENSCPRART